MGPVEEHLVAAEKAVREGHFRSAQDEVREALRFQPDSALGYALLGMSHMMMGAEIEAREELERAVGLAPRDSRVRYYYYAALARLGDAPGARAQLTYYCQLEPANVQAKPLLERLGGPLVDIPPLPKPPKAGLWYDGGGTALSDAGDILDDEADANAEPAPGPGVVVCPDCERRTPRGWNCKFCDAPLPH
jgi:Flp pilus assembly protein TadD